MATAQRINMLQDLYKDDDIECIENSTVHARVNGRRAYITNPDAALSIRHELIADLAATGMKPSQIARTLQKDPTAPASGHYNMLLRDPRIRAKVADKVGDVLDQAKERLKSTVIRAAENVATRVEAGDIKMSQYVLGTQGVTDKPVAAPNASVTMDFGSWLSTVSNTKNMHSVDMAKDITCDSSVLPAPTEGELL